MKYLLYVIEKEVNFIKFKLMIRKTRNLTHDIPQSSWGLLNYSHTQNYHTFWNALLQCIQPGFSSCTFNRWIAVVFWKRRWLWPLPMWLVCFMVRRCSQTQFQGWCEKRKHGNKQVVYNKLVRNCRTFQRYSKHSSIRTHERTVACKTQITGFLISQRWGF